MIDGKTADNVMRLSNYYDSAKQHRNNIEQMIQTKNFDINAANDAYQFMMTGTDANSINHQASSVSQGFSPGRSTPSFASSYYAKSLAEDDAVSAKDNIVDLNTVKNKEPVHLNKDGSLEIQIHREVPKPRYSYQKEQASTMPDFGDLKPLPPRSYPREAIPVEREQANQSTTNQRSLLTTGVDIVTDFTPGVSNLKDASIALTGVNPITGEKVGLGGRLLSGFFALPVVGNAGKYIVKGGALAYKGVKSINKGTEITHGLAKSTAGSIRNVNPTKGTRNCVNCSIATDSTLAGRPASALSGNPTSIKVLEDFYGSKFGSIISRSGIEDSLLKDGSGSRGIVFGSRGNQVGHVFNVINQNGIIRFLDGQTGKTANLDGFHSLHLLKTTK